MQKAAVPIALAIGAILGFIARPIIDRPSPPLAETGSGSGETPAANGPAGPESSETPNPVTQPSAIPASDKATKTITEGPVTITSSDGELPESIKLDFDAITKQMQAQQQEQDGRRIALELAQLKERLGLTAEQEEQIKKLLEARAAKRRGGIADLLSLAGNSGEDAAAEVAEAIEDASGDSFESDLAALLEPGQRSAYDDYRAERRANAIEASAGRELAAVQSMLSLTDEQKDRAFEAFTEIAAEEIDAAGGTWGDGGGSFNRMLRGGSRRRDALEPILTPEQMEIYRNSPQVGTSAVLFGSGTDAIGEGGVISTVRIETMTPPDGGALLLESPPASEE